MGSSLKDGVTDRLSNAVRASLAKALPSGGVATVCLSGGVDSSLLLHLAFKEAQRGVSVCALHVNHGLASAAGMWEEHCRDACERLGVAIVVMKARLDPDAPGLEERAREARLECCEKVESDAFLMAHHADDLAETLLLRMFRGSGTRGLASMRPLSSLPGTDRVLLRPFLGFGRGDIEREADRIGVKGVDDPANRDLEHNRNWLRHEMLPEARRRFPGAMDALAKAARNAGEAVSLLDCLARMDDESCSRDGRLDRKELAGLGEARVRNWLSWSLASRGRRSATGGQLSECARQLCGTGKGFAAEFNGLRLVGDRSAAWWEVTEARNAVDKMSRVCAL